MTAVLPRELAASMAAPALRSSFITSKCPCIAAVDEKTERKKEKRESERMRER